MVYPKSYSEELNNSFLDENWMQDPSYSELLLKVEKGFETANRNEKMQSFTYLLMDSRITKNLPIRSKNESREVLWATFIDSIFYVGKGIDSRGYSHLSKALKIKSQGIHESSSPKNQRILDIWSKNFGVIILHIFQDRTSHEAHTNEAAMIDALGLSNLTNKQIGTYYGIAENYEQNEKRKLGLYLLCKAFNIHNREGERPKKPENFKVYRQRSRHVKLIN